MNLARREFAKGGLASQGFLALPGGLFAAPPGWKPKKSYYSEMEMVKFLDEHSGEPWMASPLELIRVSR